MEFPIMSYSPEKLILGRRDLKILHMQWVNQRGGNIL